MDILLVGIGGFLGAIVRAGINNIELAKTEYLPLNTLLINMSGSFLLSLLFFAPVKDAERNKKARLLLGTGFLGAYTTFSTFSFETVQLFKSSGMLQSFLYILFTLCGSLGAAWLGMNTGKRMGYNKQAERKSQ